MKMGKGRRFITCAKRANHMTNPNHRTKLVGLGCEFQHSPYRQTYPTIVDPLVDR